MRARVVVGVDLGGTNLGTAVITDSKDILAKLTVPTNAHEGPEAVIDAIERSVRRALAEAGADLTDTLAVCVGSPGPLNWQTGIVYHAPNLPGWNDIPLGEKLHDRLAVPCYVDNDANVACYGEYWLGAGQGVSTLCLLTLGTGVGGGLVINGELIRGIDGTAAEIGHMKVMRGGRRCGCGRDGCFEAYASVTGMLRTAAEGMEGGSETLLNTLCHNDTAKLTGKMISEAIDKGDDFAKEVMEETGAWIGIGIANLVNILNPEKIVLCGGMVAAGDILFDAIRQSVDENAFEVPAQRAEIVPAGLGDDSGVIGAAGVALSRYTVDHRAP